MSEVLSLPTVYSDEYHVNLLLTHNSFRLRADQFLQHQVLLWAEVSR